MERGNIWSVKLSLETKNTLGAVAKSVFAALLAYALASCGDSDVTSERDLIGEYKPNFGPLPANLILSPDQHYRFSYRWEGKDRKISGRWELRSIDGTRIWKLSLHGFEIPPGWGDNSQPTTAYATSYAIDKSAMGDVKIWIDPDGQKYLKMTK